LKEKAMSNETSEFWQTHSLKFLECAFRTDRQERIQHADGHGKKTGDCGDTVEFFIMIEGSRITNVSYDLTGCVNTNACANAVIDLLAGKEIDQAWEISPEDVSDYLESLPGDHLHCAELAVGALYLALADTRDKKQSPWKKLYQ
jgi:nitrogen fixation protein NifU and related proteins